MAVSITQLLSPLVKADVLDTMGAFLGAAFGMPLELQPGGPVMAVLDTIVEWAVDDVWNPVVLPALQAQLLDYASGDWLSLRAWADENRPRIEQVSGTQRATFENRGSFSGTIAVGAIRIASTGGITPASKGATYTNTTTGTLVAFTTGAFPTVTLTMEADVVGTSSNAQVGDFALWPVNPTKAPINVYLQSIAGPILGTDEETDANLKTRIKAIPTELSPTPPRQAYTSVALDPLGSLTRRGITPPSTWNGVAPAITRVRVVTPGNAAINVYLASASGPAAGDMATQDTDVYKAWLAITLLLNPFGTSSITVSAATLAALSLGTIVITLDQGANVQSADAVVTATNALDTYFSNLPIGGQRLAAGGTGAVFVDAVLAVLGAGPGVIDVTMTGFTVDRLVAAHDVVVQSFAAITINQVQQS